MKYIEISLVVPVYNEEANICPFYKRVESILSDVTSSYEVIFINDGSTDDTMNNLKKLITENDNVKILDFSRNFGKEAALTAGIDASLGNVVIPIDVDLQHPPEIIIEMMERWRKGFDVVLCQRENREIDNQLLARFANMFYKIHNKISDCNIPENVGDFRLMDRKVVEALKLLPERQRFMKGIFAWVGFNSTTIKYNVESRFSGSSKFSGWKLWNFAIEGITSFSAVPLRIWTYIGALITIFSLLYAFFIVIKTVVTGSDIPGYPSLFTAILFFGGIQLLSIGILGEYIGRIYTEVKHRPIYIIKNKFGFEKDK